MTELPTEAKAVIIGGGVVGCSVAYHLVKLGWRDVVVLERKRLTSGTTWHAAGLIGQLRTTLNLTKLAQYSAELYRGLEAKSMYLVHSCSSPQACIPSQFSGRGGLSMIRQAGQRRRCG